MPEGPANTNGGTRPTSPAPAHPPTRLHPPTSPGPVEGADEGRLWPNLVGIAVIVLQAIGLVTSLTYIISLFFDYENLLGGFAPTGVFSATNKWKPFLFATYGSAGLLSVLAIVGASYLLVRRRRGVRMLIAWSLLRIPYAFGAAWCNAMVQRDTTSAMGPITGRPGGPPPPVFMPDLMFWTAFAVNIVFALAVPLFLLIWFHVPRVRRQVKRWA